MYSSLQFPLTRPRPFVLADLKLPDADRNLAAVLVDLDRYPTQCAELLRNGNHRRYPKLHGLLTELLAKGRALRPYAESGFLASLKLEEEWRVYEESLYNLRAKLNQRLLFVGVETEPSSYSILATGLAPRIKDRLLATGLDGGSVILGCGMPGSGKSQAALVYLEGAMMPSTTLNQLGTMPRAGIVFHTDPEGTKMPQLLAAIKKNSIPGDIEILHESFGERPTALSNLRLVLPWFLFEQYQDRLAPLVAEGLDIRLLHLPLSQIGLSSLEILIGAEGDDPQYVQFILNEARNLGSALSIAALQSRIEETPYLTDHQKGKALQRLQLLSAICDPPATFPGMHLISGPRKAPLAHPDLWDLVAPGSTTIFMLSGQRIGRDALPLIAMLMSSLMQESKKHGPFQRLFLLDEINNLDGQKTPWGPIVRLGRQIRHQGSCLVILGQDFLEMPPAVFGLANMIWLFRPGGPKILKHLRENAAGFDGVRFEAISSLPQGQALVVTRGKCDEFGDHAQLVVFRPPRPEHGGHTKAGF